MTSPCCVHPSFTERDHVRRIIMAAAEQLANRVLESNANTPTPGLLQAFSQEVAETMHDYLSHQPLAPLRTAESE